MGSKPPLAIPELQNVPAAPVPEEVGPVGPDGLVLPSCAPQIFSMGQQLVKKCQKALAKFPSPDVYTFRANHLDHPTISRVQSVTSRTIHPLRTCRDTFRNEPVASSKLSHVYLSLLSVKIEDSDMR